MTHQGHGLAMVRWPRVGAVPRPPPSIFRAREKVRKGEGEPGDEAKQLITSTVSWCLHGH